MILVALTVVLAIAAGVAIERRIGGEAARRLRLRIARLMLFGLLPVIAYVSIARLHLTANVGIGIVVGQLSLCVVGLLMWRATTRGRLRLDRPSAGAAIMCTIQANTGFFGLPLCAALFSQAEFTQAVAYDLLVSTPAFLFGSYTIGAIFGRGGGDRHLARHILMTLLKNPVLYAVALALVVPESLAPEALVLPSKLAVFATLPLGFVMVGITLSDEADAGAFRFPPPLTRAVATVIGLRMVAMPAIVLAISLLVVRLPATYPLMAAMPVGVNTVLVAHQTGLGLRLTADAIAWSTSIAVVATLAVALALAAGLL